MARDFFKLSSSLFKNLLFIYKKVIFRRKTQILCRKKESTSKYLLLVSSEIKYKVISCSTPPLTVLIWRQVAWIICCNLCRLSYWNFFLCPTLFLESFMSYALSIFFLSVIKYSVDLNKRHWKSFQLTPNIKWLDARCVRRSWKLF